MNKNSQMHKKSYNNTLRHVFKVTEGVVQNDEQFEICSFIDFIYRFIATTTTILFSVKKNDRKKKTRVGHSLRIANCALRIELHIAH